MTTKPLGEWVSNTPKVCKHYYRFPNETPQEAEERYHTWRAQFIEGPPKASNAYTVEQLEAFGLIGLYKP